MLSRVESMDQLYILDSFSETKMYASKAAVNELTKMNKRSLNKNPSRWNNLERSTLRVSLLNCGSLRHQINHIRNDDILKMSDVICLPETWIWEDEDTTELELQGYKANHVAVGRGKGVSVYYRESKFCHIQDSSTDKIQLTKLSGNKFDLIAIYKAPLGNDGLLKCEIQKLIDTNRSILICGAFNMCFIDNRKCRTTKYLMETGFQQLVKDATHIGGGHLDQVYLKSEKTLADAQLYSPYYTAKDHDAVCITLLGELEGSQL